MQKNKSQTSKSKGFIVKLMYDQTHYFTKRLYPKSQRISIKTSAKSGMYNPWEWFCPVAESVCGGDGFDWLI